MMYIKATRSIDVIKEEENAKTIIFLEPGMNLTQFSKGSCIKFQSGHSIFVNEKLDKLMKSIESLEV